MPDKTIQPFEGQIVVVNGICRSDDDQFDGLPAFSELDEGNSYHLHAEYGPNNEVVLRHYQRLPNPQ